MATFHVNRDRLNQSIHELAMIGATAGGGVTRLALTDEDRAGRDLLRAWMEAAGLTVRVDDLGTMTGRRAGGTTCRRCRSARTSTPCARAAASTARSASSPGWR